MLCQRAGIAFRFLLATNVLLAISAPAVFGEPRVALLGVQSSTQQLTLEEQTAYHWADSAFEAQYLSFDQLAGTSHQGSSRDGGDGRVFDAGGDGKVFGVWGTRTFGTWAYWKYVEDAGARKPRGSHRGRSVLDPPHHLMRLAAAFSGKPPIRCATWNRS